MQRDNQGVLRYELRKEEGPEHAKIFTVEAYIGDVMVGCGKGHS